MLQFRIDVDYPYPSRIKSFVYTVLGIRLSSKYLENSKIIAKMINESTEDVKAYWFFTHKTIPDKELLELLDNDKHEVALHVVNNPYVELALLEKATGKKINYYTIHGTARLFARIMWKRWKAKEPEIPHGFPLCSFHQYPAFSLDGACYLYDLEEVLRRANVSLKQGAVLYFHPIWLFQRGKLNHRGSFYCALRRILNVDKDLEKIRIKRKFFFKIAEDPTEYEKDIIPTTAFLEKLLHRGIDVFTFVERKWCSKMPTLPSNWVREEDNIAILQLTSFEDWWKAIDKKTRNMIRKAEKTGIETREAEVNDRFAEGVWRIYNETPIRQDRAFPHYGISLKAVQQGLFSAANCVFIGAYLQDELVGFAQLVQGDNIAILSQLLSMQKHFDKAVNNALIAKAVEVCGKKGIKWLMYGRIETAHPSLDRFKKNNGFSKFSLTRFYVPLTRKGKLAVKLGLHKDLKDALPKPVRYGLLPLYCWVSRSKVRIKLMLRGNRAL